MKLYTKKGDAGSTSLLGGTRVQKYDLRIESYGTVDELNSYLGLLRDQAAVEEYVPILKTIQSKLFTIGSWLAMEPGKNHFKLPEITAEDITQLEVSIDEMDAKLPALKNFVLPGGHPANSIAHIARTVCRRAERRVVELNDASAESPVSPLVLQYLNRLSDWLFQLSRAITYLTDADESPWLP